MERNILYIYLLFIGTVSFVLTAEDEISGSGSFDEDPMKLAKNQNVEQIANTMKAMQNVKSNEDLSQNLKTGARQVMHTIASKLVSHASNKITNHVGNIIKSSLVNRKSDVSANVEKDKSLSSTTEVVLPALSVVKLTKNSPEVDSSNDTVSNETTSNSTSPIAQAKEDTKESSSANSTSVQAVEKSPSASVNSFVKAPPIGPMESIKIEAKGQSKSYSNFTKLPLDGEDEIKNSKIDVLKFEDGLTGGNTEDLSETTAAKSDEIKVQEVVKPKTKAASKKKKEQKRKQIKKVNNKKENKKKVATKKSKVDNFPKIILYQGPISKALESMLSVQSTPNKQNKQFINAPMTFEQATADIKRSQIPNHPAQETVDEDGRTDEYENEIADPDDAIKRSKIVKTPKKYAVKGYPDVSVRAEKKSLKNKKVKKGKKKLSLLKRNEKSDKLQAKDAVPILTINSAPNGVNTNDDSKFLFKLPFNKPDKQDKAAKVKESSPFGDMLPGFLNKFTQMLPMPQANNMKPKDKNGEKPPVLSIKQPKQNQSIATDDNSPVFKFPFLGQEESSEKPKQNKQDEPKAEATKEVPPTDKDDEDSVPTPPSTVMTGLGDGAPPIVFDQGQDENDDDDEENDMDKPEESEPDKPEQSNSTGSSKPITVSESPEPAPQINLENNPLSLPLTNLGTPNPVMNSGNKDNQSKPARPVDTGVIVPPPAPPALPVSPPSPPVPPPSPPVLLPTNELKPNVPNDVATISPTEGVSEEEERELMEQVDTNTQSLASLSNQIRDVESRLTELETAVNDVNDEVKQIEKKLETKPAQQESTTESFSNFAGPLKNLQGDFSSKPPPIDVFGSQQQRPRPPPLSLQRKMKKPHVLKEFFVPLPSPDSPAGKAIQNGAPVGGLPFPLNVIVSKIFRKMEKISPNEAPSSRPVSVQGPFPFRLPVRKPSWQQRPWHRPQPLPDISFPPREHDIDRLELELGKTPISRDQNRMMKKPKIIIFSKSPQLFDLTEKPCDGPCENGGQCMGGNVCKCPFRFSGPKCERALHRSAIPEDILDILGSDSENKESDNSDRYSENEQEQDEAPKKNNLISLPLMVSNVNEDRQDNEEDEKTAGLVDQNKLVNVLQQFAKSMPYLPDIVKRYRVPGLHNSHVNYARHARNQAIVPRSEIFGRYGVPLDDSTSRYVSPYGHYRYPMIQRFYRKKH